MAASGGVATFAGLTLDKAALGATLKATSGTLFAATTSAIDVTAAPATQLVVMTQPLAGVTAGSGFDLVLLAEDDFGNVDPNFDGSVTLGLMSSPVGSALGGTSTVTASSGTATFSGLTLNNVAAGDTLQASSGTLKSATTSSIPVVAAAATQLLVTTEPQDSVAAGSGFGLVVTAEDGFGNIDTTFDGSVTLALASDPAGDTLGGTLTVPVVAGLATFAGLTLDKAGPGIRLRASSGSLDDATSSSITVSAAPATKLVITTPPQSTVTAGTLFGLVVSAEDRFGNVDPNFAATVSLASSPGTPPLGGTPTASASSGVATFSDLTLDKAALGAMLQASSGGLSAATTSAITVAAAAATQLVITTPPQNSVTAGSGFGLVLMAEDPFGNTDPSFGGNVTVALANNPAEDTLRGTSTLTPDGGAAAFSGLTLEKPATGVTLTASADGLSGATTTDLTVSAGPATQWVITTQPPDSVTAGSAFGLVVMAEDAFGNVDPIYSGSVSLASSPGDPPLGGTSSATASDGVATFSDLTLDRATIGDTLQISGGNLSAATTHMITGKAAPATQLVVTTQPPAGVTAGNGFSLVVSAEDEFGNVDPNYSGSVALAPASNPTGGTFTMPASSGVASFSDLKLNTAATSDTLQASSGALKQASTSAITVGAATATRWVITTEPPASVTAGNAFGLDVKAEDPFGNTDPSFSGNVTVALANNPSDDTLGGTLTMTADAGVAAFSGLTLGKVAAAETLGISGGGLSGATTNALAVAAGPATHLVITSEPPGNLTAGRPFGLVVMAEDGFGNVDPNFSGGVTLALASNPGGAILGGTTTVTAGAGVATFSGLTLNRAAAGDVIAVSSGGLSVLTSALTVGARRPPSWWSRSSPPAASARAARSAWSSWPRTASGTSIRISPATSRWPWRTTPAAPRSAEP